MCLEGGKLCICFAITTSLYYLLAGYAPPQPLRLLDTEWCSVELVVGQTHDHSLQAYQQSPMSSCYHAILHWYGTDGSHAKLDLRKLIRKAAKDVSEIKVRQLSTIGLFSFDRI